DSSTLEDVALVGGFAEDGGGAIRMEDSFSNIRRVRILNCQCQGEGNAAAIVHSQAQIDHVLAMHNGSTGAAFLLVQDLGSRIRRCTFAENGGVAIVVRGGAAEISRSVFTRPGTPAGLALAILVQDARGNCAASGEGNFFEDCSGQVLLSTEMRTVHDLTIGNGMRPVAFEGSQSGVISRDVDAGAMSGFAALVEPDDKATAKKEPAANLAATPNPFSPQTTITYSIREQTVVDLGVFNILGQRIRTLFAGDRSAGEYSATWDGRDDLGQEMPPGVYYARITQGADTESKRIVLVR
ncbi:MAG TPA: FlgD immunoglobulin-like domain containing protein, partial [bacterium]|nr:FlgD immunoglobulin-like domain containing protein [bacterium]